MKKILAILVAALAMTGLSSAQVHVLVSTNGSLIQPSDFFAINSNLVSSAIGPIDDDNVSFDDADGVWTATSVGPALEELNDSINAGAPNGSGSKVHWSQLLGVPAGFADGSDDGSGGGSSVTNLAQLIAGVSTNDMIIWNGTAWVVTNRLTLDEIAATSLTLGSALGISSGGSGATTAAGARTNFGLIIGTDVQAQSARLSDIAGMSYSTGDVLYWSGSALARLPIGTNGQVLGVSGGALGYIAQTGTGGGGVTNYSALSDVALSSPVEGQVPVYNGTTGKWNNRTPATNPLIVDWIGSYGIGSRTNYSDSTNVVMATFSVPPSADPAVNGQYLSGNLSMLLTNGTIAAQLYDLRFIAAGTKVSQVQRSAAATVFETFNVSYRIVRESATTASLYADGVGVASSIGTPNTGLGTFGGQVRDFSITATNFAWNWSSTNALEIQMGLNMSGSDSNNIGVTRLSAGLYAMKDDSAYQSTNANLATVSALTGGTSTNFLAGDGTFKQVTTNMIPGLVAALAAGGSSSPTTTRGDMIARGASSDARLAVGQFGEVLASDGTDPVWRGQNRRVEIYEEFASGVSRFWGTSVNAYYNIANLDTTSEGTMVLNANNNAAYVYMEPTGVTFGNGRAVFEARVQITRLSSAGDFKLRVGFGDSSTSSAHTDGIWFEYTDNVNSGNWVGSVAAAGSGSSTNLAVGPAINTWYTLKWDVDAAASSVTFSVNGANSATLSSANIPNSTSELCGMNIIGTSSSANLTQTFIDYVRYVKDLTTSR